MHSDQPGYQNNKVELSDNGFHDGERLRQTAGRLDSIASHGCERTKAVVNKKEPGVSDLIR